MTRKAQGNGSDLKLMSEKQTAGLNSSTGLRMIGVAVLSLIAGALFIWWLAARADREMRADLLQQARLVARSVNTDRIKKLTGTEADLNSPDYKRLKEQLMAVRSADPECRFLYLTGRTAEGKVFFFVDSEQSGSNDYSPPGQVYGEVSEDLRRVFDTRTETVEGPLVDRWGVWVSGLVPISDPKTGAVIAVLGMDINARDWKLSITLRTALPVGLLLVLLIGVVALFSMARSGYPSGGDEPADAGLKPGLRSLLPLAFPSLLVLVVLVGGDLFYSEQKQLIRQGIEEQLNSIASLKMSEIVSWREDRLRDVAQLSDNHFFNRQAAALLADPKSVVLDDMRDFLRFSISNLDYLNIMLVDPEGRVRLSLSENTGSVVNSAERSALASALRGRKPVHIDLHSCGTGTKVCFGVAAPLFHGGARGQAPIGAVIMLGDAGQFLYPLIRSWPVQSETAETLLVRRDGDSVLYLNELRYKSGTALKLRVPLTRKEVPAVMAALGRKGLVEGKDYRGAAVLSVLQPIPDSPWFLIAKVDTSEIFANWKLRAGMLMTLLMSIVAMAGVFGFMLWQRRSKSHFRTLLRSSEALQKSEQFLSATLRSIGDGVVSCDTAGNVTSLNVVAERLTGWSSGEAIGRPIAEIFNILNAGTRQASEIPVLRALHEDRIIGLANHTVLIARDGTERQIADSCAPIHDAAGAVIGAVLVFRDVSEDYLRRKLLKESEEKYRRLIESSYDIIYTLTADGIFTFVSPSWTALLGHRMDQVTGRSFKEFVHPDDMPRCLAWLQKVVGTAQRQEGIEYRVRHADGTWKWHTSSAVPLKDEAGEIKGIEGTARDISAHKKDEAQILDLNNQLQTMLDSTPTMIFYKDKENHFIRVNKALAAACGMTVVEMEGKSMKDIYPPETAELYWQDDKEVLASGNSKLDIVERMKTPAGELWVQTDKFPFRDPTGAIIGIIGFSMDVTERKRAQDELKQTAARQTLAARAGGVGIWDYDVINNTVLWDDQMYALYGITKDKFGGVYESWQEGLHPDDRARCNAEIQAAIRGEKDFNTEFRVIWPDGSVHNIKALAVVQRDGSGKPLSMIGTNWDITSLKQAESYREMGLETMQALNDAGELKDSLQHVVAIIKKRTGLDAVGIRMQDGEDFPYAAQEGFPEDFLRTENTLIERDSEGSICRDKDGKVKLECTCGLVISGKTDPSSPFFTRGGSFWTNDSFPLLDLPPEKDPRYHPRNNCMHHGYASMALVPIRDENSIIGLLHLDDHRKGCFTPELIAFLEGLASQVGTALMRRRADEALKETAETKSKFASMVSHELRSPMSSITLGVSLILEDAAGGLSPEHKSLLELVRDSADRLGRLINDVLDFQKMAAGKMTFEMQENDIDDVIQTTVRSMSLLAKNKGLNLESEISDDIPRAKFDNDKITQVLTNLLSNAIAHTEKGTITVNAGYENKMLHVSVRDTGVGIKAEDLPRLFQAFEQLGSGGNRKIGGTGLGLAISKEIILAHNGKIWAESEPGKGSVFQFTLPVTPEADNGM